MRNFLLFVLCALSLSGQELTLPLKPNSVRFAVIGDMGTGKRPQFEVAERMMEAHRKAAFPFVIMVGDNIYGGKGPTQLQRKFEIPYKPLLDAGVKFYAALGNHDDPNERFYKPFNMNGERYYSFEKGNVHFFVIDSTYLDPKQLAWLDKGLSSAGSEWKICYFHHAMYSSAGRHGSASELGAVLEPMFVKYGVQVVFAGHDHVYERIKPQKGIHHFTVGASGQLRNGNLQKTAMTAVGYDRDRSFLLVEISGQDMFYQAISRTGATVDSGTIPRKAITIGPASATR